MSERGTGPRAAPGRTAKARRACATGLIGSSGWNGPGSRGGNNTPPGTPRPGPEGRWLRKASGG